MIDKLLDLYHKEYMCLPVKLLIILAVDKCTQYGVGMDWFLNKPSTGSVRNSYQRVLEMLFITKVKLIQIEIRYTVLWCYNVF